MKALLAAERRKLTSLRGPWVALGVALALAAAITALGTLTRQTVFDPTPAELGEPALVMINNTLLAVLLGALVVTPELRFGGQVQTYLTTPRRGRVLVAKLVTALGVGMVLGLLSAVVSFAVALPILGAQGVDVGAVLGDPVFWGRAAAAVAGDALMAAAGAAIALLLHSLTAVILIYVGMYLVESLLPTLVDQTWVNSILDWSWLHAESYLVAGPDVPNRPVAFWLAGLALLGWIGVVALGAAARTLRRDVA